MFLLLFVLSMFGSAVYADSVNSHKDACIDPVVHQARDIALLTSSLKSKVELVDIKNSTCSDFISKHYGVTAHHLCVMKNKVFVCNGISPPYGAEMQSEFFSSLQIDQSHLSGALSGVCRPREQMKNNQANHCTLSDHRMFKEFSLGLHTCFCSLDHTVVVSICAQDQDKKWISTGEFEGTFVREKIIALCKSKIASSHQTMCGCSESLIPSEYISCLKDKASEAK